MNAVPLIILAYSTVFTAELLGDKMVFSIASLTARYPTSAVLIGLVPAQMVKMAAAVLFGHWLTSLPRSIVVTLSMVTFSLTAVALWRQGKESSTNGTPSSAPRSRRYGALLGFSTVFFTEWGDVGQIAAAALVSRYGSPWTVWIASTAALMTKGVLAATLGRGLTSYVPNRALRAGAAAVCLVLAVASALSLR